MIFKNVELYNIEEIIDDEKRQGLKMSRVPGSVRNELNEKARKAAFDGSGCEIRFNIEGESVIITIFRTSTGGATLEKGICEIYFGLFQGSYLISPQVIENEPVQIKISKPKKIKQMEKIAKKENMPFDPNVVRLILPYDWRCYLLNIEGDCSPPKSEQVPEKKYLAYGSSITHGSTAVNPGGIYTRKIADKLGMDLINLGLAGSAYLDKGIADYIAVRKDWEFALLELGINVIDLDIEEFENRVDYFISKIAKNNQHKWIFCIDIFTCSRDYGKDQKVRLFREVVRDKVRTLNLPKLVYISGKDLLTDAIGLTSDLLHPSTLGMNEIADNLYKIISKKLDMDNKI